jgi:acyl-CoA synthetase (AMP-forming)/AMP-acid ligase II
LPEGTADAFVDEWFSTGDIGLVDEAGVPGHTFGYQRLLEQPVTARGAPTTIRKLLPKEIAGVCDAHDLPGDGCSHSGPPSTHI